MVTNILCCWGFLGLWFPWMRLYHLETLTSLPCPAGTVWSASGSPRRSWLPWQHSPRKHLSPCRPAAWAGFATQCWHCNLLKEQRQKRLLSHVKHIEYLNDLHVDFHQNYKTFSPVKTARASTTRTFMTDTAAEKKHAELALCGYFSYISHNLKCDILFLASYLCGRACCSVSELLNTVCVFCTAHGWAYIGSWVVWRKHRSKVQTLSAVLSLLLPHHNSVNNHCLMKRHVHIHYYIVITQLSEQDFSSDIMLKKYCFYLVIVVMSVFMWHFLDFTRKTHFKLKLKFKIPNCIFKKIKLYVYIN